MVMGPPSLRSYVGGPCLSCTDVSQKCAGHSLGAAVAVLSTLRLLQQLPTGAQPAVSCLTFACPAIGNLALAEEVAARGWSPFFKNLLIPGVDLHVSLHSTPSNASVVAAASVVSVSCQRC